MRALRRPLLLAVALVGACLTAPANAQDAAEEGVTVKGRKLPPAEAPRSATCEVLVRDPHFRARVAAARGTPELGLPVVGPTDPLLWAPTRLPRNPDYSAPPLVPAGSPLPEVGRFRFGQDPLGPDGARDGSVPFPLAGADAGAAATFAASPFGQGIDPGAAQSSLEAAAGACRYVFGRGSGTEFPDLTFADAEGIEPGFAFDDMSLRVGRANARFAAARAFIVSRDRTLPMGFALFDQGRFAEALPWFRRAARKLPPRDGGEEATLFVGKLLLQGLGDRSDPTEAVRWLKKAALFPFNPVIETPVFDPRQADRITAVGEAAVILANVYRSGFGPVARDPRAARRWLERAFAVGHVPAAKVLGDWQLDGIGAPSDAQAAVAWYRKAATLNHAAAQVALARMLESGADGVARDRAAALAWYGAAARSGHPDALYAVARARDLGDGLPADPTGALALYKAAALAGSADAQVAIGTYFYEGRLVPKDDAIARRWFQIAAERANADGLFNLAAMRARGEGGGREVAQAWVELTRAAALGHGQAPRAVAALEQRMSPAERQTAAALRTAAPRR